MNIYNTVLFDFLIPILGNDATFASDLKRVGQQMFGKKFSGVFAADRIPNNFKYAIVNLDKFNESGSHWLALVDLGREILVYDSFGRNTEKIIQISDPTIQTDDDAEQSISEDNCGPRALSFLYIFDNFGFDAAMLI